jgi:hypothetical protein
MFPRGWIWFPNGYTLIIEGAGVILLYSVVAGEPNGLIKNGQRWGRALARNG